MKKIILSLVMLLGAVAASVAQSGTAEENQAIQRARIASAECVDRSQYRGAQIEYYAEANMICDYAAGTGNIGPIFGYKVTVVAVGHCPGNVRELCDPFYANIATVYVSCISSDEIVVECH